MTQDEARALTLWSAIAEKHKLLIATKPGRANWPATAAVLEAMLAFRVEALPDGYVMVRREVVEPFLRAADNIPKRFPDNRTTQTTLALTAKELAQDQAKGRMQDVTHARLVISFDGIEVGHFRALREALSAAPVAGDGWGGALPYVRRAGEILAPRSADPAGTPTRDALVMINAALHPQARPHVQHLLPAPPSDTEPKP